MEINNELKLKNNIKNELNIEKNQNNFIKNIFSNAINVGLDIGIKTLLPDIIEEHIINIKNNILDYGLKDGLYKTLDGVINLGKSTLGIFSGNFESLSQVNNVIKNSEIIDSLSSILDFTLNKLEQNGNISSEIAKILRNGKKTLLDSIESNIDKSMLNQQETGERLEKAINKWKMYFDNRDFNGMEKEYKKVKKELCNLLPMEKTLKEARNVESIHTLIKTNGHNFNLTETEQELLKKME